MPTWRKDTSEWIAQVENNPYGKSECDHGVMLMSAVINQDFVVCDRLFGAGLIWWKLINQSSVRQHRIPISVSTDSRSFKWVNRRSRANRLKYYHSVHPTGPNDLSFSEHNWTEAFSVSEVGIVNVKSNILITAETETAACSTFFCTEARDHTMREHSKKDWLGAIATMAKGVPGGEILVGPFLRLYDQEKESETYNQFNQKLEAIYQQNQSFNVTLLKSIANSEEVNAQFTLAMEMALQVCQVFLNEKADADRNRRDPKPNEAVSQHLKITEFPIPIPKKLLIGELLALFPGKNIQYIQRCLVKNCYDQLPSEDQTDVNFIAEFVDSIHGKRKELLHSVFKDLWKIKEESDILNAAWNCLAR